MAVVCFDSNDVYFIDRRPIRVLGIVPVGQKPQDLTYSPDGQTLYTANVDGTRFRSSNESRTVTATIPTDSPTSVGVLPNGRKAYVTNLNAGTVTILERRWVAGEPAGQRDRRCGHNPTRCQRHRALAADSVAQQTDEEGFTVERSCSGAISNPAASNTPKDTWGVVGTATAWKSCSTPNSVT